jgi:YD repeat-containing protein
VVAVEDAFGQVTVFAYEHSTNPDLLTKVTDPFARTAILGYDSGGRLSAITEAIGMTSTFAYGAGDFIVAMTTPYGTTTFRPEGPSTSRSIEAVDPAGGRERLVFHLSAASWPATDPTGDVPTGFSASNSHLDYWNSFYWDKAAMATAPGDYAAAVQYTLGRVAALEFPIGQSDYTFAGHSARVASVTYLHL